MARLLIIGAGGFGREVAAWAWHVRPEAREWDSMAFLDANPAALAGMDGFDGIMEVVGDPATYEPLPTDRFVCGIGHPRTKLTLCRALLDRGAHFINLIHPSSVIGVGNRFGIGTVICALCVVTSNVYFGDFVTLNASSTVGHDARLGDGCMLSGHADVTGYATLGEGVFVGSHGCVLPSVVVGDYAIVGAGSVATRKVKPHTTVFGVPARKLA